MRAKITFVGMMMTLASCGGPSPNVFPTAAFSITPAGGAPPLAITADASSSRDSDGVITNYQWDFGNGASAYGRRVAYTYTESGSYTVRLTVTDDRRGVASTTRRLVVNAPPTARITAIPRAGAGPVPFTARFSAEESSDGDGAIESYAWRIAEVAKADASSSVEHTFDEPGVYPVRLTVTDDLGGVAEAIFEVNASETADALHRTPYLADGPQAEDLRSCVHERATFENACALARLPALGQEYIEPSVDNVMSRVLVSHRWAGDAFKEVLQRMPADTRLLARTATAIVISSDILGAFYSLATGAVYFGTLLLWRTPEEFAATGFDPDIIGPGAPSQLNVEFPTRYVWNNRKIPFLEGFLDPKAPPGIEDIENVMARILFHEFAHSGDVIPYARLAELDSSKTVFESGFLGEHGMAGLASSRLIARYPLRSELLKGLAAVQFWEEPPTREQFALRPEDLVTEFADGGGVLFYSYLTQFEDLANLLEAALMSYHYGHEQDTALASVRPELIVAWGQRGRLTDTAVIDRTRWTVNNLYPGNVHELDSHVVNRPPPLQMRPGESWADNLTLAGGEAFSSGATPSGGLVRPDAASLLKTPANPNLIGCIHLPPGTPEQIRARIGL